MKKIFSLSMLAIALLGMTSCTETAPMDTELYPPSVYIVGAHDRIVWRSLDLSYPQDTVNISVAVSGNQNLGQDVKVTMAECPEAITEYNRREVSAQARQYRVLQKDIYNIPSNELTIKSGEVYHQFPVYVNPSTLHCDSLYMLAFRVAETSAYKPNKTDTVALVNLYLSNKYSGQYYMKGVIKNTDNPADSMVYVMPRKLQATDDGRTVRMFHYNNEWVEGTQNDYRPTHCFKISVNDDNSLKLSTWDKFDLVEGGGTYYPEQKAYYLWYVYRENGKQWRTEGCLYLERKSNSEQHAINDWIEDQEALHRSQQP